jgi:hypothetical protein
MTSRPVLTLGSLVLIGFAVVLAVRFLNVNELVTAADTKLAVQAPLAPVEHAKAAEVRSPLPTANAASTPDEPSEQLGQAKGNIHFERQPAAKDLKGASIDINVKAALGLWQPGESRMRILLLETEPRRDQVAQLVDAIESGGLGAAGKRSALIEMKFVPNAQAFDRNELDSATLVASDGDLSSTADALNGLEWAGSLPSPRLVLPAGSDHPTIELTSGGDNVQSDRVTWQQSWRVSLAVPVIMRN